MATTEEVREWVLEVIEQGADRIELRARHDDARIRVWTIAANDTSDKPTAEKLADQIAREATRDGACQNGSTIVYVVFAFRGENDRYLARLLVQVEGRSRKGGG